MYIIVLGRLKINDKKLSLVFLQWPRMWIVRWVFRDFTLTSLLASDKCEIKWDIRKQ